MVANIHVSCSRCTASADNGKGSLLLTDTQGLRLMEALPSCCCMSPPSQHQGKREVKTIYILMSFFSLELPLIILLISHWPKLVTWPRETVKALRHLGKHLTFKVYLVQCFSVCASLTPRALRRCVMHSANNEVYSTKCWVGSISFNLLLSWRSIN